MNNDWQSHCGKARILCGDAKTRLADLEDESVQCCVTSPPYWGLRNYGHHAQMGQEPAPEKYVENMHQVFTEVRRVLKDDGTLWLNLGDTYAGGGNGGGGSFAKDGIRCAEPGTYKNKAMRYGKRLAVDGIKAKDLVGIPWMIAFALRTDGWYLRSDIIWSKPNPMPESVTDRPTRAHEYVFLLSKSARYYYDAAAIREEPSPALIQQIEQGYNGHGTKDFFGNGVQDASGVKGRIIAGYRKRIDKQRGHSRRHAGFNDRWDKLTVQEQMACGSNKRSVWTVAPANCKEGHFATFPPELIKPMILAGCPAGGTVLDPFLGSGTTSAVAAYLGRCSVGVELNPDYCQMARERIEREMAQELLPL